jgi:hydroxyacylglutathione hydrolase
MELKQFVNKVFDSNTWLISDESYNWGWLIDIGDAEDLFGSLDEDFLIKGVFITHPHFDHIYGINKLLEKFPGCMVFTSLQGEKGLFSSKINLSFYHEEPIEFQGSEVKILHEGDKVELFKDCFLETIETPGHDSSCLTYKISEFLFTGDSYIPGVKVVTKLKGGDKLLAEQSIKKIKSYISPDTIICPGHGLKKTGENLDY